MMEIQEMLVQLGRFPEVGIGNPLCSSCLRNPVDREAWRATVHGVTELDTTEHAQEFKEVYYLYNMFLSKTWKSPSIALNFFFKPFLVYRGFHHLATLLGCCLSSALGFGKHVLSTLPCLMSLLKKAPSSSLHCLSSNLIKYFILP